MAIRKLILKYFAIFSTYVYQASQAIGRTNVNPIEDLSLYVTLCFVYRCFVFCVRNWLLLCFHFCVLSFGHKYPYGEDELTA